MFDIILYILFRLHDMIPPKSTWPHQILLDTGKEGRMTYYQQIYTGYDANYNSLVSVRNLFSNREIFDFVSRSVELLV